MANGNGNGRILNKHLLDEMKEMRKEMKDGFKSCPNHDKRLALIEKQNLSERTTSLETTRTRNKAITSLLAALLSFVLIVLQITRLMG